MNITQESDYAIRAILILANEDSILDANAISKESSVPLRFLLKILRKLGQAGIVKSYRGAAGGYRLNKAPKDITLLDVIQAIEGKIQINRCFYDEAACNSKLNGNCSIHRALFDVQLKLTNELKKINFDDLKNGVW
jgi:Rrf2 family protein